MNSSELLKINVNEHVEKKNGLSYLSWAWAWAEVLKADNQAWFEVHEWMHGNQSMPCVYLEDHTAMVKVSVYINEIKRTSILPVMDHRNKAIENPNAFQVNTAIMRCLAKAIAMHGLGLYIYAGEDLPEETEPPKEIPKEPPKEIPKVVQGTGGSWNIKVSLKPEGKQEDWISIVQEATAISLASAKSESDVMQIFKVNRPIFDQFKALDKTAYDSLMITFKQRKEALK